ncbi:MAG: AlpA family phage regulatory protein [Candidimonas sp.]|nr:MAG: AlpA family phage regulatory protein [Candidimonas sp.]
MTAHNAAYVATTQRKPRAPISPLPETGFARLPIVAPAAGVAGSTIWLWVRKGKFPRPVKVSERVTAWRVEDVREWMVNPQAWQAANVRGAQ